VSPKEVKREIKKLIYEKPVLIGLGDTLKLGGPAPVHPTGLMILALPQVAPRGIARLKMPNWILRG